MKEKENWGGVAAVQTRNSTISHDMSCYADVFAFESSVMIEDWTTIAAKVSEGGAFHSKIRRIISEMGIEGEMGDRYRMGDGVDVSIPFMLLENTGSSISVERAEIMQLVHAILSHIGRNGRFQKVTLRRGISEQLKRRGSLHLNERKSDRASGYDALGGGMECGKSSHRHLGPCLRPDRKVNTANPALGKKRRLNRTLCIRSALVRVRMTVSPHGSYLFIFLGTIAPRSLRRRRENGLTSSTKAIPAM